MNPDLPERIPGGETADVRPDDPHLDTRSGTAAPDQPLGTRAVVGTRPDVPTWELDVRVDFQYHERSDTSKALTSVPEIVVCVGTVFLVCPTHYAEEVVMDVHATLPDGRQAQFAGAGYGDLYESTPILEVNDQRYKDKLTERNTAGLISAIVGAADRLVDTFHQMK